MKRETTVLSRRGFLGQASCAAVSSIPILNTLLNLRLAEGVAAASTPAAGEYRALVCLFLAGGNDSYNMLVPREASAYAAYHASRAGQYGRGTRHHHGGRGSDHAWAANQLVVGGAEREGKFTANIPPWPSTRRRAPRSTRSTPAGADSFPRRVATNFSPSSPSGSA